MRIVLISEVLRWMGQRGRGGGGDVDEGMVVLNGVEWRDMS